MKNRVAVIAALVSLIAIIAVPITSVNSIANERNSSIENALKGLVTLVGDTITEENQEERLSVVSELFFPEKVSYAVYDADHNVVVASDSSVDPLPAEMDHMVTKAIRTYTGRGKNNDAEVDIYAIYQFDDGAFLLVSSQEWTFASIWKTQKGVLLLVAISLVAGILFFATWRMFSRKERNVKRVMATLDEFSEGDFSTRIAPLPGDDEETAEYNAIIDRLQTRIFKQRDRNRALSTVMAQMQNGIIAVDQDMKVILATPVAKQLLGIMGTPEGKPVSEASKDVKLEDHLREAMGQNGVYMNEVAARLPEGRGHRPLRLYVSRMTDNGTVVGALAMVEDITEMRRMEQMRTDFAANVSHELKTPLTTIRGFVETLEAGAIDRPEMAHKFLRIIHLETERLTRLINDILSISKLESGDDQVTTERIRLDKIAHDVCEMLSLHAQEKKISLNYRMNEKPIYIMGNHDRVEQMLINLTENAIKYNQPEGSVTVQVFADEKQANVTVSDTGIGIAEEHIPRLFERFYRVDKGRSRQMGGTGLGLAIVKHIVMSMNGEIEVHSRLGEGTEFLVTLPLAPKDDPNKDTIFNDDNE